MNTEDRVALIRRGNELFNQGDIKNALKVFLATEYQDGIVRVADHLYYEEHDQIGAMKLYRRAGYRQRIEDFAEKAAFTIRMWLDEDKESETIPESEISQAVVDETAVDPSFMKKWQPKTISTEEIIDAQISTGDVERVFRKKK